MSSNKAKAAQAVPCRLAALPRGRHKLDREAVRDSQRGRLLGAMLELVGSQGYAATSVPQVVAAAKASRNAFYEHFKDKEDCFLTMCAEEAANFSDEVLAGAVTAGDWTEAARLAVRRALNWWQARPLLARAYLVEIPLVGPRAVESRSLAYAPFEQLLLEAAKWARIANPALRPLPARAPHFLITGITELIADLVRQGRGDEVASLEEDLVNIVISVLGN
ncbi:MAG: TetR/AcrR family transcriptional regulator [Stagnimonas sp.]|nr:TetR/AcrR family transcriptional regulator [Stagnimonas sp.]